VVPPALTPRQRQILDYIASFVAGEGYLPSTRQIAAACGLRSPTSVRRALQVLEDRGHLVRDPDRPRLATVSVPDDHLDGADLDEELGLCELIMGEMEGAAEAARRALDYAPDLAAQELAHREALARIRLHSIYGEVRERLLRGGARRPDQADLALAHHQTMLAARLDLITSWDAYCLSTFVLRVAVNDFVVQPRAATHMHLRHAYAAELALLGLEQRPDLHELRDRLRNGDAELRRLLSRYDEVFHRTLDLIAPGMPALASPGLGGTVARTLDSTLGTLPLG
jgi:hypothetical protein